MTILRVLLVASLSTHVTGTSPDDTRQSQQFRPVSLGDLVKAVGANRDGLEGDVDLTSFVADHAIFMGEAVGVAARTRDDSDGSIFVGWRWPGELWRYRFLDDRQLDGVRSGADVRLGRVESLRSVGAYIVVETRLPSSVSSVVMQRDLTPLAHVVGSAKLALPSGTIVLYDASLAELAILDPATRQVTTFFAPRASSRAGVAPAGLSIASLEYDERTDTLTFTATFASEKMRETVTVACRPISRPSRACLGARKRLP